MKNVLLKVARARTHTHTRYKKEIQSYAPKITNYIESQIDFLSLQTLDKVISISFIVVLWKDHPSWKKSQIRITTKF